ncbi:LacI family transcriptional regulator [Rhodoplanes elegans]|uniref:LacI family transcriptional regulator n=2 Tax=Rhodoplanes elegans TaxID=29408 RepID=A0A327KN47_9BRAD|nr:LacI family transcriptional regulator [Rhodoplanes elegans]RAI39396.1 LacI family transcriptional regulator [Rhodoplanes elegans]
MADRSGRTTATTSRSRAAATFIQSLRATLYAALLGLIAVTLAGVTPARAAFPDRVVRIVVPFAAGGGTDLIARRLADEMGKVLGQRVIVENRPGAGTILGSAAVASSPPDGYTLLMATFAHAVNPSLNPKLPYDTFKAFAPVALVARSFNVVVVNPDLPWRSVADLVAAAKRDPGKINYGSFGNGTSAHLAGELFKNLAQVDLTHVPYQGAAPAITDLMGGQIQVMFTTAASVASHIQSGRLRPLAVTSAARASLYPDLPTVAEAGVAGYVAESWYGLYAPAGTPPDIVAVLNQAARRAAESEAFAKLKDMEGLTIEAGAPADLDRYVRAEAERWKRLVEAANIRTERQ